MKNKSIYIALIFLFGINTIIVANSFVTELDTSFVYFIDSIHGYHYNYDGECHIKEYYEYNENGHIVTFTDHYLVLNTRDWNKGRTLYAYDYEDKLIQKIREYEEGENVWLLWSKETNTYNENGQLIETIQYRNNDSKSTNWGFYTKKEFSYTIYGQLAGSKFYYWNENMNDWERNNFEQYYYNDKNLLYMHRYNIWDEVSEQYVYSRKTNYEFDEENRIVKSFVYGWNPEIIDWEDRSKSEYRYNDSLLFEVVSQRWDSDSTKWFYYWKYSYQYDDNGNRIGDTTYFWRAYLQDWEYNTNTDYFFSLHQVITEVEVGIPKFQISEDVFVYPNPNNGVIRLSDSALGRFYKINVYNNNGQLVLSKPCKPEIKLKSVSRGIYFVELIGAENRITRKIFVE